AADGTETCAVRRMQDLVRQLQREGIASPRGEVERVVVQVFVLQLLVVTGIVRLILARAHGLLDDGLAQAAEARPAQRRAERELEHGPRRRLRYRQHGWCRRRHRNVLLAALSALLEVAT